MTRRKTYKIFDIDYLSNGELNEDDLYYLFETKSLSYSLLIDMFKKSHQPIEDEKKIIAITKNKDWQYNYFWTDKQREDFENDIIKVYKNIYFCDDKEAQSYAQFWVIMYGLTNSKLKNTKNIYKLCE
jgi:hypothetical protein